MKKALLSTLLAATILVSAPLEAANSCSGGVCVADEDMKVLVQLLRDQKCRAETPPKYELDSIVIIVDKQGRIYGSGSEPLPYTLRMKWCNYEVEGRGMVKFVAATHVEPTWGFRFRPKFTAGLLPLEAVREKSFTSGLDVGALLDFAYWKWANVNVHVAVRSFGLGVGIDVTDNFGLYFGYANTWADWRSSLYSGVYFGF